jgi:WD40 repeat protein
MSWSPRRYILVVIAAAVLASPNRACGQAAHGTPAADENQPRVDCYGEPLPKGAIARMGMTGKWWNRHFVKMVTALSPDRKILATAGPNDIRLWDVATGELLRQIRDNPQAHSCCSLLFVRDGHQLAGAADETINIWDMSTGKRLHELPTNGLGMVASPDGKLFAAPDKDGSVCIWDSATLKQVAHLPDHPELHYSAWERNGRGWPAFSKDQSRLVMNTGNEVYHWDLATSKILAQIKMPLSLLARSALSPDGQTLIYLSDKEPIALWDTATGKERIKIKGDLKGKDISAFAFDPSGRMVATAEHPWNTGDGYTTIGLWNTATGERQASVRGPQDVVESLSFAAGGRTLISVDRQPAFRLWDVGTGKLVLQRTSEIGAVVSLAFTPDGHSLVSGGAGGTIQLWDVRTGRRVRDLSGHLGHCSAIAITPDGNRVISSGADGCIRVQGLDGKDYRSIQLGAIGDRNVHTLALVPSGKKVICSSTKANRPSSPSYDAWDLLTGAHQIRRTIGSDSDWKNGGNDLCLISQDAQLVVEELHESTDPVTDRWEIGTEARIWELKTGRLIRQLRYKDKPAKVKAFTPDGRVLLTLSGLESILRTDGAIHFWELATGKERFTIPYRHAIPWLRVALSPDIRTLAIVCGDGLVEFWDTTTGMQLRNEIDTGSSLAYRRHWRDPAVELPLDGKWPGSVCLGFSPDSKMLATGQAEGTVVVWREPVPKRPSIQANVKADAAQLQKWWNDLADKDARRAYAAINAFCDASTETTQFLRGCLKPAAEASGPIRQLIDDLDAPQFTRRAAATKELTAMREQAEPALRQILQGNPSPEQRRRIEIILEGMPDSPETIRHVRAAEVLERIGNADALALLERLATGLPASRLTREARASLNRLTHREENSANRETRPYILLS